MQQWFIEDRFMRLWVQSHYLW